MKTRILALLSALTVASALAGCSASALNFEESKNDKIALTDIVYDNENKSLKYTLTNGTEDKLVDYTSEHKIYKIENGNDVCVTPSYTTYGTSLRLYPESFVNTAKEYSNSDFAKSSDTLSCLTYKAEGENYDQEYENSALQIGEYKLVVNVDVYDYAEENNKVIGDGEESILLADFDYDYPHTTMTLEGTFTIK